MDEFSRYAVRVSVAQICQAVGWTKIQSTPLEVLTDFMQEYILSIGKLANSYATLLGHSEPNLSHVSLAFKDMNISFNELKDYITHFESGAALEVPKYPIQKESHLNHLKPGSREVLTRPVHIHDHLPPMFPELEGSLLYHSPTYDSLPSDRVSPVNDLKIKPEPSDSFYDEWNETPLGEDIRPLRELSSVLMTTSGFLSSAREGKLPEVRNLTPSLPETDESKVLPEPGKTKDKENRFKEELATEKVHAPPERKPKHKKHKKKSHHDNANSKSNKVDNVFFNKSKQTSGSIKKGFKKDHNMGTFKKELKLSKKVHSSPKQISSVSSNPGNLLHKDYKDLKEHRNLLKHNSLDDTKDNNLSLIDLFSVPQVNGNEKYNYDTDNIIDVVNSSPLNNIEYSNNSSPLLELDDPGFLPQGSPFFQFDRKSPDFVSEMNNLEVKTENKSPEVTVDSTSTNYKCDNETPSFKQKSSPDLKHEFLSPDVKFESPTFDFERNSSVFDQEKPILKEKAQETILDNKIDCPGAGIPLDDLNTLLNQSMSSRSKKKKKKDKKSKSKDKNVHFAEGDTKDKMKIKKKKKDSKKDKHLDINNQCLLGTNVDLEMSPKKMKLEINCNIQKEPKVKQCASSSLLFHSSENYSEAKINESQHSIPSHFSTSVSESPVGGGISHSSASASAPTQSTAPPGLTVGSQGVGLLSTFAGHSANAISRSTSSASLPASTVNVSHTSGSAGTASHISTSLCSSTSQLHQEPHRKSKNEVRRKEKKEKRREKESMKHLSEDLFTFEPLKRVKEKDKRKSSSPLPKITFKLGPSPPKINSEPKHQKIIIKPVVKTEKYAIDSSNKHQPQRLPSSASSYQTDERFFPQPAAQVLGPTGDCPVPLAQQPAVVYDPNQIWICPACNRPDDGSPMIACDKCDLWFHWVCVGIFEAIEGDWYCKTCLIKKEQNKIRDKKKKQKKKKI